MILHEEMKDFHLSLKLSLQYLVEFSKGAALSDTVQLMLNFDLTLVRVFCTTYIFISSFLMHSQVSCKSRQGMVQYYLTPTFLTNEQRVVRSVGQPGTQCLEALDCHSYIVALALPETSLSFSRKSYLTIALASGCTKRKATP
jgi:hypothetical protein